MMLRDAYFAHNNMNDAITAYQDLLARFPMSPFAAQAQFREGEALLKAKQFEKALLAFQYVIQYYTDRELAAQAQFFVGQCYKELENIERAVESYLRVINEYPDVTSVDVEKLSIGIFFQDIKMYDLALKAYSQVARMTLDPEIKLEAQYYVGDVLYESGEFQQAILEFLKVTFMGFSPKNIWVATARFKIAEIYESLGEWNKALEFYEGVYNDFGGGDPRGQRAKEQIDAIKKRKNE